jgi:hypothetical protein
MQNALSAIEKFSIKRRASNILLKSNIVEWIVNLLRSPEQLREYTLDYVMALLLNLSLRSEGIKRCEDPALEILKILKPLMTHQNINIRSHINGTLYALFSSQKLKEEGRVFNQVVKWFRKWDL